MTVHCADCGFLSFRNHDTYALEEVDEDARKTGGFRSFLIGDGGILGTHPLCFARAFDLLGEIRTFHQEGDSGEWNINLKVINKERECPSFCSWIQGFSPKEHKEMLHDQYLLELQAKQQKQELDWQEAQEDNRRQWESRQGSRERLWNLFVGIVNMILGILLGLYFGKPP